jgi:hypothetical protein
MMKGKKLIVFLMAVCMMISMSFGMVAEAATTAASTQEQAELMAGKAYTIKKGKSGKWFYQNSRGKTDKKQGWKKDKSGKYAYYVGSKGYVTAKVTGGVYYKWSDKKWKKQTLKKNSTKTICGKAFYVNENGKISKTTGWMKVSGKYAYYVNGNGAVSVKITKGVYQKWSKTGWKKQKLDDYVGGIITIQKKAFFVGSDKKIIRKCGWTTFALGYSAGSSSRGYTGTEGSVLYYESEKGAYKINDKGEVPKRPMKSGWNDTVFVKNGKVQINKTVEIDGYKNVFDKNGKRVVLKVEDGNIVRSDNGKAVGAGNYKIGSGNTKTTYVVDNSGQIKTSGTVKINGKTYTIGSDGKVDVQKPSNGGSGDQQDDKKNDDSGNGNSDSKQHVCKWLVVLDKNQNPVQSNYKKHDAVMGTENQLIRDAWDEPIYAARKWLVCNTCSGELGIDDQDCAYENTAELDKHQDAVHHGGNHLVKKIIDYKHHDAEYADVSVIKKRAYEEWDETYKCTVCGDTMTVHVVCGDIEGSSGEVARIPSKSGDLVWDDGTLRRTVKAGVPYGVYVNNDSDTNYLILLKDHGFIK